MTDARDAIKRALAEPRDVVRLLGLDTTFADRGKRETTPPGEALVRCKWHEDRNPSLRLRRVDGVLVFKCWTCDVNGDVLTLIAQCNGLDVKKDFRNNEQKNRSVIHIAAALAGKDVDDQEHVGQRSPQRSAAEVIADAAAMPDPDEGAGEEKIPPPVIAAFWERCRPCAEDPDVAAWLASRGLDAAAIDVAGLARALPPRGDVQDWAQRWQRVHRCIVPMYDARGELVSVKARAIAPVGDGKKSLSPKGGRVKGALFVDVLARMVLQSGGWPWTAAMPVVMVMEGEMDFWRMVTRPKHLDNGPPARWATIALPGAMGGWTSVWAAGWPKGTTLKIWPDMDDAGEKATAKIVADCRRFGVRAEVVDLRGVAGMDSHE